MDQPQKSGLTRWVRRHIAILVIAFPCCAILAATGQAGKIDRSSMIDVKLEPSRSELTAGTGIGVIADVKNVSDKIIYLHEKHAALALPPELEGPFKWTTGWWANFPSESHPGKGDDYYNTVLALKPGDSYRIYWFQYAYAPDRQVIPASENELWFRNLIDQVRTELNFVFFSPGDYKLTALVKYWTHPPNKSNPEDDYRTTTQTISAHIGTPQSVLILGAVIGGLIAYFTIPQARRRFIEKSPRVTSVMSLLSRSVIETAGIVAAALLSAIVTILLSRISGAQSALLVTANDFWGAITVGFAANYGGTKLLGKLLASTGPGNTPEGQAADGSTEKKASRSQSGIGDDVFGPEDLPTKQVP